MKITLKIEVKIHLKISYKYQSNQIHFHNGNETLTWKQLAVKTKLINNTN